MNRGRGERGGRAREMNREKEREEVRQLLTPALLQHAPNSLLSAAVTLWLLHARVHRCTQKVHMCVRVMNCRLFCELLTEALKG